MGTALNIAGPTYCRPFTSSRFEVEHAVSINGIHADIRNFAWDSSSEAFFHANSYYIDYSLGERTRKCRLFHPERPNSPPPGRCVFLPKGVELAARNEPCESRLLCLTFDHERALGLFEDEDRAFLQSPCFDVRIPNVNAALQRLAEEVQNPGFGHDVVIESLALVLVVELCRHLQPNSGAEERRGKIADWRLNRLKERIEEGLVDGISVPELAQECRMSARHLIRTFKNTTGMLLSDYVAEVRMRRAREQLAGTDCLIKTVAFNCGFKSAAAFSAAFQRATGQTPREFRQRAGSN